MIVSFDTIMKPPYHINSRILRLISSISEKLGAVNAYYLNKPSPQLRKQNRIKTIHSSLQIEGNSLTEEQVTVLLENKKVTGPKKDILEVLNAIKIYEDIKRFKPYSKRSFLSAHKKLMSGLIESAGSYRRKGVGITKGTKITHIAPSALIVPNLMKDLFSYLKNHDELLLIKSCVFHYEMEFIHPFADGNGRLGRFWQTLILLQEYEVFEFLPFESLIRATQADYYKALSQSDKAGNSTIFIEYMLGVIDSSLSELLMLGNINLTDLQRLDYFKQMHNKPFSRKDYMLVFKHISSATASRDLLKGYESGLLRKTGLKNKTQYEFK